MGHSDPECPGDGWIKDNSVRINWELYVDMYTTKQETNRRKIADIIISDHCIDGGDVQARKRIYKKLADRISGRTAVKPLSYKGRPPRINNEELASILTGEHLDYCAAIGSAFTIDDFRSHR